MSDPITRQLLDELAEHKARIADLERAVSLIRPPKDMLPAIQALDVKLSSLEESVRRWREDDRYSLTKAQVVRALNEVRND